MSDESDFVYVDDDGNPLPPEQATNVEIFERFFKNVSNNELTNQTQQQSSSSPSVDESNNNNNNDKGEQSAATWATVLASFGGAEKLRETASLLKEGKILEQGPKEDVIADQDELNADDEEKQGDDVNDNEEDEEEIEEIEEEEEETSFASDQYDGFSREYTDQDHEEQWILDDILNRKLKLPSTDAEHQQQHESPKNRREDTLSDYDDEDLIAQLKAGKRKTVNKKAAQESNQRQKEAKVPHYLCKWRWFSKPTWETRDALLDLGYAEKIREYDVEHDSFHKGELRLAALKTKKFSPTSVFGNPVVGSNTFALDRASYRYTVFERIFPDYISFIHTKMLAAGQQVTDIVNIAAPASASDFFYRWASQPELIPFRTFHGTRQENLPGITRMGLKLPGSREGVTVLNGQALGGTAIYTALSPSTPMSYARGCNFLLVCVALDPGSQGIVKHHGDWRLFYHNDLILPVWLIRYSPNCVNCPHEALAKKMIGARAAEVNLSQYRFIRYHNNLTGVLSNLGADKYDLTQEGENDTDAVRSTLTGVGTIARTITHNNDEYSENNAHDPLPGDRGKARQQQPGRDPDVKVRAKEVGHKKMSKRLIKQLPKSLKEVYGY